MGDLLAVDLQGHRIELEELTDIHGEEHGHLRTGGKQQILFKDHQVPFELHERLFDIFHLVVQGLGGCRRHHAHDHKA